MAAPVLTHENGVTTLDDLLQPEPLPGGAEPEQRVVICGISWERYLAFDEKLGNDRPGPRLYYLEGELEIITTSIEHERITESVGRNISDFLLQKGFEAWPRGQTTMRQPLKKVGAEPDESWCVGEEKEFPDLVMEVTLTSGGVNKLDVYRWFQVPEVWLWRRDKLEIFLMGGSGDYAPSPTSRVLPGFDLGLLERCVAMRSWLAARRTFRSGLSETK